MQFFKIIRKYYDKSKKVFLYIDLILVIFVFYADKYLGSLRNTLLPAAIGGAFAIILESLFSISDKLERKNDAIEYENISQAVPKMIEILKKNKDIEHNIKIFASTGGTTINVILPDIFQKVSCPLNIEIQVIDPDTKLIEYMPEHWPDETRLTFSRLKQLNNQTHEKIKISCWKYEYIPCLHGILIDKNHLFLGTFIWQRSENKKMTLSGAQAPHTYYFHNQYNERNFQLFETWFERAPKKLVI